MSEAAPDLLTVRETADFLRTSEKAIRHMLDRGQLPGVVRLGRRVLVRRDDLRRHVGLAPSAGRATEGPSNDHARKRA